MSLAHPIESLSLCPEFFEAKAFQVISTRATRCLEFSNGMQPGEMDDWSQRPANTIHVQPSIFKSLNDYEIAFQPSDDVLRDIMKLYDENSKCNMSERLRFDEIPSIATSYYTVILSEEDEIDYPLYTRHPTTGEITKHEHPYHTLPPLTMPAHPTFLTNRAMDVVIHCDEPSGLVYDIYHFSRCNIKSEFLSRYRPLPSSACPELVHSSTSTLASPLSSCSGLKRKRDDESDADIASWLDEVKVEDLDILPSDDLGTYASEQAKPYEDAIAEQATWIATSQRQKMRKRQRASALVE